MLKAGKAIAVNDLQARARELKKAHANSGQRMQPSLREANHRGDYGVSMMWGHRVTADPEIPVSIPGVKQHIGSIHVQMNEQDSLSDNQHRGQNTDDEVHEQHIDPQESLVGLTKGKRSRRIENINQRREKSIFYAANRPVGENANESATEQHDGKQDEVFKKPRARGYTYMPRLWAISSSNSNIQRLQIEFNKYGKPIGPNKSKYVEFLGSIVRNGNLAPLDFKDWHKVPATFKKDMLDKVKECFVVPVGYEKFILQALGKSWRAFKCRVKTNYFNPELTMEQNLRTRPNTKDERVKETQWKSLVEYWCSEESKKTCGKNKENRALKKMQHTIGKMSFAQVYEDVKNVYVKLG